MNADRRNVCKWLLGGAVGGPVVFSAWDLVWAAFGLGEPSLRHTFYLNPADALRHNQIGKDDEGPIEFSQRVMAQYDRTKRLDCVMEFVTSDRKGHAWKVVTLGPEIGLMGKCETNIGKYVRLQLSHSEGRGYAPAGNFLIGVAIRDGKKKLVAYNEEKRECKEQPADKEGFKNILGWVFAIAAAIIGIKIAVALLAFIIPALILVLFAVVAKALWDSN